MCTVTVVPRERGSRLICNRDERRTRPPALAPQPHEIDGREAVFPLDPQGGGTWIGVNDVGLVVALLNVHRMPHATGDPLKRSRGLIVRELLRSASLSHARAVVDALNPGAFAPFQVVIVHLGRIVVATSEARWLIQHTQSRLDGPLLFYAPVAIWVLWLSFRHRGLSTITASNPGIPDGGVVGESKFRILSNLPSNRIVPSALVEAEGSSDRARRILEVVQQRMWTFPIILKPDVGQRGVGVRMAQTIEDIEAYCAIERGAILVQPYHPGPFEAGIFYWRMPGERRGKIFSITDKQFPQLIGDGRSTVEALIWAHPRYRLQATTFQTRHRGSLDRVLERGEIFRLAIAGNHAQGAL